MSILVVVMVEWTGSDFKVDYGEFLMDELGALVNALLLIEMYLTVVIRIILSPQ